MYMIYVARQAEERVAFTLLFMKEMYLEDSYLWAFDATIEIEGVDRQACGCTHVKNNRWVYTTLEE
ncbi:MAG: hypothetical protein NTU95_08895 [Methanothrix sp.]|nr:hypothetical protein [Methanothrix sp.]